MLFEGKVLVQLKEDAAGELDILDTVECSHWLALELLLDAVRICEVEDVQVRPESAFMEEDGRHLEEPRLVGGCTHLFAKELQGWSGDIAGKEILIDR